MQSRSDRPTLTPTRALRRFALACLLLAAAAPVPAEAADVSTHVLDLARGVGGRGVPVTLARRSDAGSWTVIGTASTDAEGRVRRIGDPAAIGPGIYRLQFDMTRYPDAARGPSFPRSS